MEVTVSLVSCNQRHDLEVLIPSLLRAVAPVEAEVLLVDNNCTDRTTEFVRSQCPEIQVRFNPHKSGYGENHNLNLLRARGRYFAVMNSDMIVESNIFLCLRNYMDQHPDVGIVAPKILNQDGTIQGLNKRYPTILDLLLRGFLPELFQSIFRERLDHYEMRDVGYERECDVPFLSGAFMFCRTELLRSLSGFDTGYFLYFEDVDLCRRMQRTHRTVYCPDASVTHLWRRAAHQEWIHTYYFAKSALRYFQRWGFQFS